jgi:nitroimidazol reductase NimA-like FMN-containing flavoprotein (pyridoxamine 5'-phosphate oxidase superfamily)
MLIDDGLELLTEAECRQLVATADVGRIGVTVGGLPAIFPVNYRMIDGGIVFRTAPGSKLAAATREAVVAFEVDDYDALHRSGWSVLVVGKAHVVHDLDLTFKALAANLEPWAAAESRTSLVRVDIEFLSGRRIVTDSGAPRPSRSAKNRNGATTAQGEPS